MRPFFLIAIFSLSWFYSFGQRNNNLEDIFFKVQKGYSPASFFFNSLHTVSENDKLYNLALYLLYQAYEEKAKEESRFDGYGQSAIFYDSAFYYLEYCQKELDKSKFSKFINYYLPFVNQYGIYESEEQLQQDLFSNFKKKKQHLLVSSNSQKQVANSLVDVLNHYDYMVNIVTSVQTRYIKNDLIGLSEQEFSNEAHLIEAAIDRFEVALSKHGHLLKVYSITEKMPCIPVGITRYHQPLLKVKNLKKTGQYSNVRKWFEEIEKSRLEKLGGFWTNFIQTHQKVNKNINLMLQQNKVITIQKVPQLIYEKINFIEPNSAIIPYLNYLEHKQDIILQLHSSDRNYHSLIRLYGVLQQGKLSLSVLEERLNDTSQIEKDARFLKAIHKDIFSLQEFSNIEKGFLDSEEKKISKALKETLTSDFLIGRFEPKFTSYGKILFPLYEQKADFLEEDKAFTTRVEKLNEDKFLIAGTIKKSDSNSGFYPFMALIEKDKVEWLQENTLPLNAFGFTGSYDYYQCTALFKTVNGGWGGIYYPGKFSSSQVEEKQSGLMVLFNKSGQRDKIIPLPVMHRIDKVCYDTSIGGFILLSENDYLSANYRESNILLLDESGEVKWKKNLPVKSFSSNLKTKAGKIYLFANNLVQVPGEQHFKCGVHIFEINTGGVVVQEKELKNVASTYATQVIQDKSNHWLIFGFKGDSNFYNLRYKEVFFYMLDPSFYTVGGGELTSTEKP